MRRRVKLVVVALAMICATASLFESRVKSAMAAVDAQQQTQQAQPQRAAPQGPTGPKNLQVLPKEMSQQEVFKKMQEIAAALGVECTFCHVRPFDQDTPRKAVARLMMRDYTMGLKHANGTALTCNDCHKGQPNPLRTQAFNNAFGKKPDIQVLTGVPDAKVMEIMDAFSKALGVECNYCHTSDFDETTPRKQIARFMMAEYARGLVKKDGTAVSCADCHKGLPRPLVALPFPRGQQQQQRPQTAEPVKKPGL